MHEGCFYCRLDQLCCTHAAEQNNDGQLNDGQLPDSFAGWEGPIWADTGTTLEPASTGSCE